MVFESHSHTFKDSDPQAVTFASDFTMHNRPVETDRVATNGVYEFAVAKYGEPYKLSYIGKSTQKKCRGIPDRYGAHVTKTDSEGKKSKRNLMAYFDCVAFRYKPCSDKPESVLDAARRESELIKENAKFVLRGPDEVDKSKWNIAAGAKIDDSTSDKNLKKALKCQRSSDDKKVDISDCGATDKELEECKIYIDELKGKIEVEKKEDPNGLFQLGYDFPCIRQFETVGDKKEFLERRKKYARFSRVEYPINFDDLYKPLREVRKRNEDATDLSSNHPTGTKKATLTNALNPKTEPKTETGDMDVEKVEDEM